MYTEDLRRNNSSNRQAIEDIDKRLPGLQVTPSFAFVVEAVDWTCQPKDQRRERGVRVRTSRDISAFMVASEEEEILRIFDLVTKQEKDGLKTLLSSIHVVAEEKVVRGRGEAAHLK